MKGKLVNFLEQKYELSKAMGPLFFTSTSIYINDLPDFLNKESNTEEDQPHTPKLDNVTINDLLFSEDLTILSFPKYDLQKKISNLENCSEK